MLGYVYLTTNLVNGKCYVGSHHASALDPNYFGSGRILRAALAKYGRENFTCQILQECSTEAELVEAEEFFIARYKAVENPCFYNLSGSGYNHGVSGYRHSEETKARLREKSLSNWQNPEYRAKVLAGEATQPNGFLGKHHTEETRRHLSEVWDYNKHVSEERTQKMLLSRAWYKHSEDTKKKISASNKGRMCSAETREAVRRAHLGKKASAETRAKLSAIRKAQGIKPPSATGKIYVKNLLTHHSTRIDPEELDSYLAQGYVQGRFKRCKAEYSQDKK